MKITISRAGSPSDHVVFYEDLVAAPEPVVRRILTFLELPWSPKVLSDYAAAAGPLISRGEHWKANNRGVISDQKRDNARLGVDEEQFLRDRLKLRRYARLRKCASGPSLSRIGDSLRRLARRG